MDSKVEPDTRLTSTLISETGPTVRVQHINRWLTVAVGVVTVVAGALGAALIVELGSDVAAPTRPAAREPIEPRVTDTGPAAAQSTELVIATERATGRVDAAIAAYNRGAPDRRFRLAGEEGSVESGPWLYRYDEAEGMMTLIQHVREAVGGRHVVRSGPVVMVAGTADSLVYTVAFRVSADGGDQMWVQRWSVVWGTELARMWVL